MTRTFNQRPRSLLRTRLSLESQSDGDWEQTLLIDNERRGVAWAVGNLANVEAHGEYVWVLDDDDECILPDFVQRLKQEVYANEYPGVVMVRMDHGEPLGILPPEGKWGHRPEHGFVGTSAFIVRADIWNANRHNWQPEYHGDFLFIDALWDSGVSFHWWDVVASRVQNGRSLGAAE